MSLEILNSTNSSPVAVHRKSIGKGKRGRRPRILLVTPEISESHYLGQNGKHAPCVKAGGLADVSALLFDSLSEAGADVHVAIPNFRSMYQPGPNGCSRRLHLCHDREFSYRRKVYEGCSQSNMKGALAFQRDVIHYVMPKIRPDLVHCHDWMTGLVPAAARMMGIPSLFTLHNHHDEHASLGEIEDRGIDAARFWDNLYYDHFPSSYENARSSNGLSMLASGILAADQMNTVSQGFLGELAGGGHGVSWPIADAVRGKLGMGRAHGITNSLPNSICPDRDPHLSETYDALSHTTGKLSNKRALQRALGLEDDDEAPILFWPSRLDPVQKGCQLLAEILYKLVSDYWALGLQVVFVADGPFQQTFRDIAKFHGLEKRIAVADFSESLSRLGYAGSDYLLMPSAYEPCGLSQLIGLRYGCLPIVHATGGLRDTVSPMNVQKATGNGFMFDFHDPQGLRWAIDEAMRFHLRPLAEKERNISRIMEDSTNSHSPSAMVDRYVSLYRSLLSSSNL